MNVEIHTFGIATPLSEASVDEIHTGTMNSKEALEFADHLLDAAWELIDHHSGSDQKKKAVELATEIPNE